jgi:cytoskeleton protein RodZ
MSEPTSTGNDETRTAAGGPGDRLQAARIERGIAIEDLANQMHLSVGILESLENNRFEDITAPIFVKGYLRSYARIVELDEGEILELYVSEYMESDPPISSTTTSAARPLRRSRRRGGLWRWWLILLLVALALGAWWYQRSLQTAETISLDAASEPPAAVSGQADGAMAGPAAGLSGEAAQRLEQLPQLQAGELPTQEELVALPQAAAEQPGDTRAEQTEAAAVDTPAETAAPEVTAEPPPVVAESAPTTEQTPAQDSGRPLQLRVTADTWADIRDASGRKLVYDLLRAGRRLELDAAPPLRLFFGNGRGVELRWKGQIIELENKIRADNTVRITLE